MMQTANGVRQASSHVNRKGKLPNKGTDALFDFYKAQSLIFVGIQLIESFRQGGDIPVLRVANEFFQCDETIFVLIPSLELCAWV